MTLLAIAVIWLAVSVLAALFFGRLCRMGGEWDESVRREVDREIRRGIG